MLQSIEDVTRPEVLLRAAHVEKTGGLEATFFLFIEHEGYSKCSFVDGLAAASAFGPARRGAVGSIETMKALVLQAPFRFHCEPFGILDVFGRALERVEKRLRPFVRATWKVKPERELAFDEWIRQACAEAELTFRDFLSTPAAFCATTRCRLDHVLHETWRFYKLD